MECPLVPSELVKWLTETYPLRIPDARYSSREIWMEAGRQQLIQKLQLENKRKVESHVTVSKV